MIDYLEKKYPGKTKFIPSPDPLTDYVIILTNIGQFSVIEIRKISTFTTENKIESRQHYRRSLTSVPITEYRRHNIVKKEKDMLVDAIVDHSRILQMNRGKISLKINEKEGWTELLKLGIDLSGYKFNNRFQVDTTNKSLIKDLIENETSFSDLLFKCDDLEAYRIYWIDEKGLIFQIRMEEQNFDESMSILTKGLEILIRNNYVTIDDSTFDSREYSLDLKGADTKIPRIQKIASPNTKISTSKTRDVRRRSFFCQLDNETHPATKSAYECERCYRAICINCYKAASKAGIDICPYCEGSLRRFQ